MIRLTDGYVCFAGIQIGTTMTQILALKEHLQVSIRRLQGVSRIVFIGISKVTKLGPCFFKPPHISNNMQKPPMKYSENECLGKAVFSLTLCKGS